MIRFGNTYVEQSNERRISVFDPLDYKILTEEYGAIVGARMVGDVLKVIQNRKVSSIYIGRAEIAEAGDGEQLVLSGNVVGTVRPSVDNFGSEHPRSICVMDRFIYFFDKNNNAFVRGAANGNFDVSLYKMKSFFEKVTNYVIDDNFDVVTGVDESSSSVYISFLKDDSVSVNFKGNLVSGYKFQFLNNYGSIEAAEEALRYMLLGEPIKVKYERKIGSRWVVDYVVVRITNISIDEEQIFIETDQHILTSLGETPIDSNPEFDNTSFRNFVIYFRDHRCETLNFLELGKNQWKSFWSFIPDTYTVSNNPMLTTIRGEVYKLFQSSADRGFFNNGNRNMEFDLYSNINRSEIKDYDAIQVHGNKAPSIELIEILPSDVYPNGQKSRLKKSKFVNVEGVYHAPFLKDMLTPGFESESAALLDGRDLKGSVARFRFVYSDSSEVLVKEICVLCTKSYYST